jgi:clan AA aspartic protease (TIGR02281 family)
MLPVDKNIVTQQDDAKTNTTLNTLFSWPDNEASEKQIERTSAQNNDLNSNGLNQDPVLTPSSREQRLAQANSWLSEGDYLTLGSFLQNYLKQHPQDMDFLLIEARLKVETTLLSDAIAHYYDLLRSPMTAVQQDEIEQQITQLSQSTIEQLRRNYSWDILAMFVEPLLQLDPSNRLYILSLALAYAELYQQGLMENVLASLDFDDPDAQSIRQITIAKQSLISDDGIGTTTNDSTSGTPAFAGHVIPLKQYGDQYVVSASLSTNPVDLLIDTGASVTAISRQYFDNLSNRYKINYLGRFSIGTAGGNIMARMYQFSALTINQLTVENLPVVILPMQNIENADGLLGMNFLREFDFKIDQRKSVMLIK